MDLMFDGLPIDCAVSDFMAKAVCSELEKRSDELVKHCGDQYKFSLFGAVSIFCFCYIKISFEIIFIHYESNYRETIPPHRNVFEYLEEEIA